MYRGSAAGVLVERGFCSNTPQKPQKGDRIHLVDLLRRHCTSKVALLGGCSRRVLQEGFRRPCAQTTVSGGVVRLKSGGHLLLFLLCRDTENEDLARTAKTELLSRENDQLYLVRDLRWLPWAMHMHTCLPWTMPSPSWPKDHAA